MASNINPNNIDTAYPVAGQDNDSQGFRDNFTNIKTNFEFAEQEIDDLQAKVIVKQALTGTTLTNDMDGNPILNAKLDGARTTRINLGNASAQTVAGTVIVNIAAGGFHTFTMDTNTILTFANWPSAGNAAAVRVIVTVSSTAYTLTLPAAVTIGNSNIQGINTATNVITFSTIGTFAFEFTSSNAGSAITIQDLNRNLDPVYLPSLESVASNAALSLNTTTSIITKTGSFAGTLANGSAGQSKVVICGNATPSVQVLTLASAGWNNSAAGNVTFTGQGQTATLTYIGGTWWCVSTGPDASDTYPAVA
jgi:hypothetical protein